jgi:hypothetical protein
MTYPCFALVLALAAPAFAEDFTDLLDPSLSQWEVFIGIPHTSVEGLPVGTFQSKNVTKGTPLGLGNDPKKVFTTFLENGTTVLHVSGEIYGGLTTKSNYADYHFAADFRWGDRKWEPRATKIRDSGILYHCHGEHGAFWNVWKSCLEYQVQETDLGDFFTLAGTKAQSRFRSVGEKHTFDPKFPWANFTGAIQASHEPDKPHGEWNHLEVYVLGDSAIHVVNGVVVMALTGATDKEGAPLKSGQIQLQSEGAECFYRHVRLSPIVDFPKELALQAGMPLTR